MKTITTTLGDIGVDVEAREEDVYAGWGGIGREEYAPLTLAGDSGVKHSAGLAKFNMNSFEWEDGTNGQSATRVQPGETASPEQLEEISRAVMAALDIHVPMNDSAVTEAKEDDFNWITDQLREEERKTMARLSRIREKISSRDKP